MKTSAKKNFSVGKLAVVGALFGPFLSPLAAAADAYRWIDSSGTEHFGTNPPSDASGVTPLKGRKFSRYSSDKMLRPYQKYMMPSEKQIGEQDILGKVDPRGIDSEGTPKEQRAMLRADGKRAQTKNIAPRLPAEEESLKSSVTASTPSLVVNEKGEVSRCEVLVKNGTAIPVTGVTVRFEFEDGSLIPAKGPLSIPPDGQATYSIPEEVLPIHVAKKQPPPRAIDDPDPDPDEEQLIQAAESGAILPPKVVIKVGER